MAPDGSHDQGPCSSPGSSMALSSRLMFTPVLHNTPGVSHWSAFAPWGSFLHLSRLPQPFEYFLPLCPLSPTMLLWGVWVPNLGLGWGVSAGELSAWECGDPGPCPCWERAGLQPSQPSCCSGGPGLSGGLCPFHQGPRMLSCWSLQALAETPGPLQAETGSVFWRPRFGPAHSRKLAPVGPRL